MMSKSDVYLVDQNTKAAALEAAAAVARAVAASVILSESYQLA